MEAMSAPTNWLVPTVADRLALAREKAGHPPEGGFVSWGLGCQD